MQNQTVNDWYILIILRLEQLSFPNSINEAVIKSLPPKLDCFFWFALYSNTLDDLVSRWFET